MKFVHLKTSKVKNSRWFVLKSLSVLNYPNKIYVLFSFISIWKCFTLLNYMYLKVALPF